MKHTELRVGDSLLIDKVLVTLVRKSGQRARLAISTNHNVPITFLPSEEKFENGEKIPVALIENIVKVG